MVRQAVKMRARRTWHNEGRFFAGRLENVHKTESGGSDRAKAFSPHFRPYEIGILTHILRHGFCGVSACILGETAHAWPWRERKPSRRGFRTRRTREKPSSSYTLPFILPF